jgi:hypothetical protein
MSNETAKKTVTTIRVGEGPAVVPVEMPPKK